MVSANSQENQPKFKEDALNRLHSRACELLFSRQEKSGSLAGAICGRNFGWACENSDTLLMLAYIKQKDRPPVKLLLEGLVAMQNQDGSFSMTPGESRGEEDASYQVALAFEQYLKIHPQLLSKPLELLNDYLQEIEQLGFRVEYTRNLTRFWYCLFNRAPWQTFPSIFLELLGTDFFKKYLAENCSSWLLMASYMLSELVRDSKLKSRPPREFKYRLIFCLEYWSYKLSRLFLKRREVFARSELRQRTLSLMASDGSFFSVTQMSIFGALFLYFHSMEVEDTLRFIESLQGYDSGVYLQDPFQGPVWDTAHTVCAIPETQILKHQDEVLSATRFLIQKQVQVSTDPYIPCGGWGYQGRDFDTADCDDTAQVLLAIFRLKELSKSSDYEFINNFFSTEDFDRMSSQGIEFFLEMQHGNGGFAAWRSKNPHIFRGAQKTAEWGFFRYAHAFDFPSADVTANVIHALFQSRKFLRDRNQLERIEKAIERGLSFLIMEQEGDGSFYGRWGLNYLYGTFRVLSSLSCIPGAGLICEKASNYLKQRYREGNRSETVESYFQEEEVSFHRRSFLSHELIFLTCLQELERGFFETVLERFQNEALVGREYLGVSMPPTLYCSELALSYAALGLRPGSRLSQSH